MQGSSARPSMAKIGLASFSGAFLEWYDFNAFALMSALIFDRLFFPDVSPAAGTLSSFAVFGVGFLFRPIGGIVFSHFGDRVGRKASLVVTMLTTGVATVLIGTLPTYYSVGLWAPALLLALRLIQGLGLGGEYGGAALLAIEHAPPGRRGLWGSLPQLGGPAGYLTATFLLFAFQQVLTEAQFMAWGWRIPFLLSVVLLAVGMIVRLRIMETPDFRRAQQEKAPPRIPLLELIRRHPRNILLALGARVAEGGGAMIYLTFMTFYVTGPLKQGSQVVLIGLIAYNVCALIISPTSGALSDRFGRRTMYLVGAAAIALTAFPLFGLVETAIPAFIVCAMGVGGIAQSLMAGVQSTLFSELFGTRVRYSGLSIAYQLSSVVLGFVPAMATSLLLWSNNVVWPVAGFLAFMGCVSFFSVWALRGRSELETESTSEAVSVRPS